MDSVALEAGVDPALSRRLPRLGASHDARAPRRSVFLHRLLLGADLISALLAGAITSLLFAIPASDAAVLTAALIVGSIGLAFFFGLYSDGGLLTWASGLSDAPRPLVAALLLSWPVFGVAAPLDLDRRRLRRARRHDRDGRLRQHRPRPRPRLGPPGRAAAPAHRDRRLRHRRRPARRPARAPRRVRPGDDRARRRRRPHASTAPSACRSSARSTSSTRSSTSATSTA